MNFTPHNSGPANFQRGTLTFANPQLAPWQWPMVEIRGDRPGPRLCVMAGMHVNEVSSIEAAVQLQRRIAPESLRGSIAILPVLNLPAVPARSQYVCPIDGKNINFSFPGRKDGSFSEALADAILGEWAAGAEVLIDLHGGDLCENVAKFSICQMTGDSAFDAQSLALARCFDAEIIAALDPADMAAPGRACTSRARAGRLAVMAESGANGILDPVCIAFHLNGVLNVMRLLGMIDGPSIPATRDQVVIGHYLWIETPKPGLLHARAEPGMRVAKGQRLARITDLFGDEIGEILAPAAGLVLWRVNHGMAGEGEKVFGLGVPRDEEPG
jgi:predicted deacylase